MQSGPGPQAAAQAELVQASFDRRLHATGTLPLEKHWGGTVSRPAPSPTLANACRVRQ
nr:hypothetical protein Ade03nite_32030 [Actinoplanes derwentensis]